MKTLLLTIMLGFMANSYAIEQDIITKDLTKEEEQSCEYISNIVYQVQKLRQDTEVWDFWDKYSYLFNNDEKAWYVSRYVYKVLPKEMIPIQAKMSFLTYCSAWVYNNKPEIQYKN